MLYTHATGSNMMRYFIMRWRWKIATSNCPPSPVDPGKHGKLMRLKQKLWAIVRHHRLTLGGEKGRSLNVSKNYRATFRNHRFSLVRGRKTLNSWLKFDSSNCKVRQQGTVAMKYAEKLSTDWPTDGQTTATKNIVLLSIARNLVHVKNVGKRQVFAFYIFSRLFISNRSQHKMLYGLHR